GGRHTLVCFRHPALAAELAFDPATIASIEAPAAWARGASVFPPPVVEPAEPVWLAVVDAAGVRHTIVLLTQALADRCLAVRMCGRDRLVLCAHSLYLQD